MPNDVPWIFPKLHGSTMRKTPREPCWVFAQSPNGDHWVLVQVHKHVGASQVTKKSRGKQLGKAKLSSDTEKKSPWENQKSRRSMIYKRSMFTHFPELCQKMSQILEFNGWLTPLEWSINCTFMWKNLSLQGQPQFSGPMFTVETHAWTYWNGDEKRSICNIQYPKYPQFDTNMWMHPTSTVVRYSTMFNPNIVFLVAYPVRSHYIQWYPAKSLVNLPKK